MRAIFGPLFLRIFEKVKDNEVKQRITKQIERLKVDPEIGKPMMYGRKGIGKITSLMSLKQVKTEFIEL